MNDECRRKEGHEEHQGIQIDTSLIGGLSAFYRKIIGYEGAV